MIVWKSNANKKLRSLITASYNLRRKNWEVTKLRQMIISRWSHQFKDINQLYKEMLLKMQTWVVMVSLALKMIVTTRITEIGSSRMLWIQVGTAMSLSSVSTPKTAMLQIKTTQTIKTANLILASSKNDKILKITLKQTAGLTFLSNRTGYRAWVKMRSPCAI